jgi:diguanylate cyclase (GGDEF)-like protein
VNSKERAERLALALTQLESGEHRQAVAALEALRDQHMPDEPGAAALSPEEGVLRARTLLALARAYPRQGRGPDAIRAGSEALFWFEQQGDRLQCCDAHAALALAYAQLGVGREALEQAMAALEIARELNDEARQGWALLRLGNAHSALGNPVQARATTQEARDIAMRLGIPELDFATLNNQAYFTLDELDALRLEGNAADAALTQAMAESLAQQALQSARDCANPYREAMALSNLNEALIHGAEWQRAALHIAELEQMTKTHSLPTLAGYAWLQRAHLAAGLGQWQSAIEKAESLLRNSASPLLARQRKSALQLLYECHKAWGDMARSLGYLEELVRLERRANRDAQMVHTQLLLIREEVQQAMRHAEQAQAESSRQREVNIKLEREHLALQHLLQDTDRAARQDALTELANRRHAEEVLVQLTQQATLLQLPLALAILDIDHFKRVNDAHGHATGDAVLRELAQLMQHQLRDADLLARWGGEEFLVAFSTARADSASGVLERLRKAVAQQDWSRLGVAQPITISMGLAIATLPDEGWQAQLARADEALYAAKAQGRNRIVQAGGA